MSKTRATWDFLRGRIDERTFTIRLCRHRWNPQTLVCEGLCGESLVAVTTNTMQTFASAVAKMLPAIQQVTRAFKAFGARLDTT